MEQSKEVLRLNNEIKTLKKELNLYKKLLRPPQGKLRTVITPESLQPIFDKAEKNVGKYHSSLVINPEKASIEISGQRYLLVRASALSIEFLDGIMKYYRDRGEKEALSIGKNILFDLAHLIGVEDALNFSKLMGLKNPIEMLSAGPVHFAYTGWAQVKILEGSNPSPDKDFVMHYSHPYSFEADSWITAKKHAKQPVCVMNAGYSSGWCEYSFGINLTSVEITCRAKGDKECTFIMAPPERIQSYLNSAHTPKKNNPEVPTFLQRKIMEEKLEQSLAEKELLLKEVHHRVKNNLQIISSLLNLQLSTIVDQRIHNKFKESIDRVRSIAALHDLLYRSQDFSNIPIGKYFNSLVSSLKLSYKLKMDVHVNLDIQLSRDEMNIDKALPCGLLLNEIISNAFKYAFKGKKSGKIDVAFIDFFKEDLRHFKLVIKDDGIGFKQTTKLSDSKTLGLQLIDSLVSQLDGKISISSQKGTSYEIEF